MRRLSLGLYGTIYNHAASGTREEDRGIPSPFLLLLAFHKRLILGVESAHFGAVFGMLAESLLKFGYLHFVLHLADKLILLYLSGFLKEILLHGYHLDALKPYAVHLGNGRKFIHRLVYRGKKWRAMTDLVKAGKVRAIGLSNFYEEHIETCIRETGYVPQLDQLEYSPWLQERKLHDYHNKNDIRFQSWSPLARGKILDEPLLVKLGEKYGKSPAQIVLRWNLQNDVIIIPRSTKKERIKENMEIFDFEISQEDMELINGMEKGLRIGFDANEYHRDAVM